MSRGGGYGSEASRHIGNYAVEVCHKLSFEGITPGHYDMRFAKPLDEELIRRLAATHEVVITIEEGAIGGLGAHVLTMASDEGLTDSGLKIRTMRLPEAVDDHHGRHRSEGLRAVQVRRSRNVVDDGGKHVVAGRCTVEPLAAYIDARRWPVAGCELGEARPMSGTWAQVRGWVGVTQDGGGSGPRAAPFR